MIELFVPGKLQQVANGSLSRAHWSVKSRWAKDWKARTVMALTAGALMYPEAYRSMRVREPKLIRFLANTGSVWDDDNLPGAIKPIRDALIGYVIHSDAPNSGHSFTYSQVVNRKERGVRITITPRTP